MTNAAIVPKILLTATILLIGGNAYAQNQALRSKDLARLMDRAVIAGQSVVQSAEKDGTVSASEKRDLKGQFALMLIRAGKCSDAIAFVESQPDVKAQTISRVISAAVRDDRPCVRTLAPFMLARWDDANYVPLARVGARFRAAAYLDDAGDAGAWEALRAADAEMQQMQDARSRWSIRFDGLEGYQAGPKLQRYLEFLAQRMLAEKLSPSDGTFRGISAVFAFHGRCDLVMRSGADNCVEAEKSAEIYRKPVPASDGQKRLLEGLRELMPAAKEDGLAAALAIPDNWARLTKLLFLVNKCREELAAIGIKSGE